MSYLISSLLQGKNILTIQGILIQSLGQRHLLCQGYGRSCITERSSLIIHNHITKFATMKMHTVMNLLIFNHSTTNTGANNQEYYILAELGHSQPSLSQRRTISIIFHSHWQEKLFTQGPLNGKIMNIWQSTGTANDTCSIIHSSRQTKGSSY